ncbi:MAG: hypothetical protein OEY97_11010 [Nitrospirota bacterium]|nr:hypothetical protein [Nitrospirota bacterium]
MNNRTQTILAVLLIGAALLVPQFAGGLRGPLQLAKTPPAAARPEIPQSPGLTEDGGFSPVPVVSADFSPAPLEDHCTVPDFCPV